MYAILIWKYDWGADKVQEFVLEIPQRPSSIQDLLDTRRSVRELAKLHRGMVHFLDDWIQDFRVPTWDGKPVFGQLFEVADADVGPSITDCE